MAEETQVLVELNQYSLHAVRATGAAVEAGGECALENKAAVEALLDSVAPSRRTDGIHAVATVWPASMGWYLSTDTEAMLDRTADSFRAIAAGKQKDPGGAMAYAVCNAGDGGPVTAEGMDKWLLAFSPLGALEKASTGLIDLKVDPVDVTPSAFSGIGAVVTALRAEGKDGSVALWDLGSDGSTLILVTARGVEGVAPCAVGMESIIEAVQAALKLKFRGAGARLFFNETYDFTDPGPRIAAALAPALKEALAGLPGEANTLSLASLSLTGRQAWFVREAAAAAGISSWQPGVSSLASALGISLADGVESSFSMASSGLLGLLAARAQSRGEWNPAWVEAEALPAEPSPPPAEPEPQPEPEPEPEAAPPPAARAAPAPVRARPTMSINPGGAPGAAPPGPRPPVAPRPVTAAPMPPPSGAPRPPSPPMTMRPPATRAAPPPPPMGAPAPSFGAPPAPPSAPGPRLAPIRPQAPPPPTDPGFPMPGGSEPAAPPAPPSAPLPRLAPVRPPSAQQRPPSFSNPGFPVPDAESAAPPPAPVPKLAPIRPPSAQQRPPSFSNPGFPMPGAEPEAPPEPTTPPMPSAPPAPGSGVRMGVPGGGAPAARGVTQLPFEAVKPKVGPADATTPPIPPEEAEEPEAKSKIGFYIAVGVVASVLAAGIAIVLEAHKAKTDANDLEQQEAIAHHEAELQLKQAEQKEKDDAERTRKEMEAAVEDAKKRAEEETRREVLAEVEAERLARLPGTLVITTVPAGASVSIDGAAPLKSPVKAGGIPPGTHKVRISLTGYDPVETSAEIRGSKTTDLGSVALQSSYGSIDLTSTPDGLDFAVRPASDPKGKPIREGKTPATVGDIVHGDYLVTFLRPGCHDHVVPVSVDKGVKSPVDTKYVNGSLELTSDPSGANVNQDGEFLGTTPLTLNDLTPKTANFDLTLPGYDSTPVSCDIPEGRTLKFSAQLLRKDRIFKAAEVKTPPQSYESPQPELNASQRKTAAEVVLSLVVRRDGSVSDVQVVSATDDDIGRRCRTAVEKWKFRPATAPDDRIVDSYLELPFKFPGDSK